MRIFRSIATNLFNRQLTSTRKLRIVPAAFKYTDSHDGRDANRKRSHTWFATTLGIASLGSTIGVYKVIQSHNDDGKISDSPFEKQDFSKKEVASHNSLEKGVWITYKGNVYDITDFIRHHPGGAQTIMMGAGGDVEPFWKTYTVHEAAEVQNLLSKFHIGTLSIENEESSDKCEEVEGPYANEPKRNPCLEVLTREPFNAETPSKLLVASKETPTEIFFVRNHLPVPDVDLNDYALSICIGSDGEPDTQKVIAEFSLDDLMKNFEPHTIECVIQCSGNRRSTLKEIKEIKGLNWKQGAISNASWTGVRLADLLDSLNLRESGDIKHVQLEGLDCDMSGQFYGASISSDVAFDRRRDVILAYKMNGQPLTRDHGFPLRFVAPGVTGARNVKWLGKIILSHEESNSHWQRNDYKSFSPNVDMFNLNYNQSISIQEMPVQSAICDPIDGEEISLTVDESLSKLTIPVKGYAYSGGGKMVVRVDISIDNGQNWMTAELIDLAKNEDGSPNFSNRNQVWSWTRWKIDIPIPEELFKARSGSLDILCRAFDAAYNSQPERAESVWNVRGVVNNSWHKIRLNLKIDC